MRDAAKEDTEPTVLRTPALSMRQFCDKGRRYITCADIDIILKKRKATSKCSVAYLAGVFPLSAKNGYTLQNLCQYLYLHIFARNRF